MIFNQNYKAFTLLIKDKKINTQRESHFPSSSFLRRSRTSPSCIAEATSTPSWKKRP